MEANTTTVNGIEETAHHKTEEKSVKFADNNNEGESTGESHVIHAEVNHQVNDEPAVIKPNVFPENDEETPIRTDETDGNSYSSEDMAETSENFIKIEERKVIERLSKVIDVELSLETIRVDTEETTEEVNKSEDIKLETEEPKPDEESAPDEKESRFEEEVLKPQEEEPKNEEEKPTTETEESVPVEKVEESVTHTQDSEANEEVNQFHISHSHEEGSAEDNTPKSLETNHKVETTSEENHSQDNVLETEESNHQNDDAFEAMNENHMEGDTKPTVEDVLIKQNGRKIVYSNEEDVDEEADQMPDVIGFQSTLKKWSTGKPGLKEDEETDAPPVSSKDKFKTLRQIRKGNTRSLMERFQSLTKS